jgi:hypothetical protein
VALVALLTPRDYYTGTNSVRLRSYVAVLQPGQRLCIPGLEVPEGTGRVEIVSTRGAHPAVAATLAAGRSRVAYGHLPAVADGADKIAVPIERRARTQTLTLCVRPRGGALAIGGMAGLQSDMAPNRLDGKPFANRVGVWFRPPSTEPKSLLARLPATWEHASRFRPGWVGPWTYAVLLLLVAPALAYAGLRTLARSFAGERGVVAPALAVMLIALANAATWATLTPTFNAPDEPDHFAYVQVLSETGKRPNPFPTATRPPHSTEETLGVDGLRLLSSTETPDGKPPWWPRDEARWRARVTAFGGRPRQDDGGGQTTAATHQPAYYALMAPAYLVSSGGTIWTETWVVRLWSALLGSLVALFTVLFIREVLPGRPAVAVAGGLLVAFLPQFGFISGAVNNDTGVNAAGALALWLGARALRRGLTWRLGLALAAALVVLPLFKQTGYALYPAVGLAVAGALWRRHDREALAGLGALVVAFVVLRVLWGVTGGDVATVSRPPVGDAGPATTAGTALSAGLDHPTLVLSYFWQTFLPKLPFMTDLFVQRWPAFDFYVQRGFAALGWYAYEFPRWAYVVIVIAMAGLAAFALRGLWALRRGLRTRWVEVAFVAVAIVGVLGGVAAVYAQAVPRDPYTQPEQGRYAFTVLAPLAAVAGLALVGAGRRLAPVVGGAAVAGMAGLQVAALLLGFSGFFT